MNEQIKEMASIVEDFIPSEAKYYVEEKDIAEALYNAGYRKTVWHKVADGDLPNGIQDVIVALKSPNGYITTVANYNKDGKFVLYGLGEIVIKKVIIWTELPKYEGEQQ